MRFYFVFGGVFVSNTGQDLFRTRQNKNRTGQAPEILVSDKLRTGRHRTEPRLKSSTYSKPKRYRAWQIRLSNDPQHKWEGEYHWRKLQEKESLPRELIERTDILIQHKNSCYMMSDERPSSPLSLLPLEALWVRKTVQLRSESLW